MEEMNAYTEREAKIYRAIFEQEVNEFTSAVKAVQKMIKRPQAASLPDFKSLTEKKKKGISIFRLQKPFYLAAASLLLAAGLVSYILNPQTEKNAWVSAASNSSQVFETIINENDQLVTKEAETLDVTFREGTAIRILENSAVTFKKIRIGKTEELISLAVEKGEILFHVNKQKKNSGMIVNTPFANVHVRGTKFYVSVSDKESSVAVQEGRISVIRTKNGNETDPELAQVVEPKEQIRITPDSTQKLPASGKQLVIMEKMDSLKLSSIEYHTKKMFTDTRMIVSKYKRLEKVKLSDGSIYTGAITEMDEKTVIIQTIDGEISLEREKLLEVEQIE